MPGGGGLKGQTVAAYDQLVITLREACENWGGGFVDWAILPSGSFTAGAGTNSSVVLDLQLHLREWKAGKEKISILVHARETIGRPGESLNKSTVHLSYFRIQGGTAKHLHSIHFDYDGEQPRHPVFHAQVCMGEVLIPHSKAKDIAFEYPRAHTDPVCFQRARVPTADMTLASVLLCIAADHFEDKFFLEFCSRVKSIQKKMPLPAFEKTRASLAGNPNELRSSHWFAHME
jgi:hypothetical protein